MKSQQYQVKYHQLPDIEIGRNYEDSAEEKLLDFFSSNPHASIEKQIKYLQKNESWPMRYHLSPQREMLFEWYPFVKNSSVLEVGAGCGALTGLFLRKNLNVYSNELMPRRAEIIKYRYAYSENLEILEGNLFSIPKDLKFDYISVVGVLEYASMFNPNTHEKNHYVSFLKFLKSLLNLNGKLLLAIENKLGYKYITGSSEDHTEEQYVSLENYSQVNHVRTFSYAELSQMILRSGLKVVDFYFPFPDYKMPEHIFSQEGINLELNLSVSSYSHVLDHDGTRLQTFDEVPFVIEMQSEKVLHKFANSFLVEISI